MTTSVFGAADGVDKSSSSSGKSKANVEWIDVNETNASGNVYLTKEQIEKMFSTGETISDISDNDVKNSVTTEKTDTGISNENETVATPSPSVSSTPVYSSTQNGITVKVPIGENAIYVNNNRVSTDAAAYIQKSTSSTMIPLRFVSVALGGEKDALNSDMVSWDPKTKTVTIFGKKLIKFQAGSNIVSINGTPKTISGGIPEITNGRMYVPF